MPVRILTPVSITFDNGAFTSSNAIETAYTTWAPWASGSQTYTALTSYVIYKWRIYQCSQTFTRTSAITDHAPDEIGSTYWIVIAPTNVGAMFDVKNSTSTEKVGDLVVVFAPGLCSGLSVLGIEGCSAVTLEMTVGATTVFSQTKTTDYTVILDHWEYFFEPFDVSSDLLFGPLPPYSAAVFTLTLTANTGATTVRCNGCMPGSVVEIGTLLSDPVIDPTDYSVKETDAYGVTDLIQREFANRVSYQIIFPTARLARIFKTLNSVRATPIVILATDDVDFSPLNMLCFLERWPITVKQKTAQSVLNLQAQGLT